MTRRIVVGIDGFEHGRKALRRAAEEVHRPGAQLEVVHAGSYTDQPGCFDPRYDVTDVHGAVSADLWACGVDESAVLLPTPLRATRERAGRRATGRRAAPHARSPLSRLAHGSIAQRTTHRAGCPVLIVRPRRDPAGRRS